MNPTRCFEIHKEKKADSGFVVHINVPLEEASRFGILNTDDDLRIVEFLETTIRFQTKASMGIYIFNQVLKEHLIYEENPESSKTSGKNIIPMLLERRLSYLRFPFAGYWKT